MFSPQVKDLIIFEEGMIDLVYQMKFRKVKSNFPKKIKQRLESNKIVKQNVYTSRQKLKHNLT